MQALSTLPNREGFKFRGIRKDGGKFMNCRLKHLPGTGMFITAAGQYVYQDVAPELAGWEPHPRKAMDANRGAPSAQVVSENKFCEHGNRISDFCSGCEQQRMG